MEEIRKKPEKKPRGKKFSAGLFLSAAILFTASLGTTVFFMTADYGANMALSEEAEDKRPVIAIDAGHGGIDAGASAADGTAEKEINLAIAQKLKKIAEDYPAEVVLTREGDMGLYSLENTGGRQREDLLNRKEVIRRAGAELAVSIHLNSFPSDSSVHGPQVFYPAGEVREGELEEGQRTGTGNDEQVEEHSSKDFAEAVQESLEINLPDGQERKAAAREDLLLFQNSPCKIILVECGFLSNAEEAALLKSGEYQEKIAEAIWEGINKILCLEKEDAIPVVDSANKDKKGKK